jgi:hypothetical protein
MKKGLMLIGLLFSLTAFNSKNPDLKNELNEKVKIELKDIELNQNFEDFVAVSFTVKEGQIDIKEVNGSSKELKELVLTELNSLTINAQHKEGEIYSYKFTFKRL